MSLTSDIATIAVSDFTIISGSKPRTKQLVPTLKSIKSSLLVYSPFSICYTIKIGNNTSTASAGPINPRSTYIPLLDTIKLLQQGISIVDVKPLKQYLANFWS